MRLVSGRDGEERSAAIGQNGARGGTAGPGRAGLVARGGGGSGAVRGGRKMALTQGTKRKVCYYYDGEGLRAPAGAAGPRGSRPGAGGR